MKKKLVLFILFISLYTNGICGGAGFLGKRFEVSIAPLQIASAKRIELGAKLVAGRYFSLSTAFILGLKKNYDVNFEEVYYNQNNNSLFNAVKSTATVSKTKGYQIGMLFASSRAHSNMPIGYYFGMHYQHIAAIYSIAIPAYNNAFISLAAHQYPDLKYIANSIFMRFGKDTYLGSGLTIDTHLDIGIVEYYVKNLQDNYNTSTNTGLKKFNFAQTNLQPGAILHNRQFNSNGPFQGFNWLLLIRPQLKVGYLF